MHVGIHDIIGDHIFTLQSIRAKADDVTVFKFGIRQNVAA